MSSMEDRQEERRVGERREEEGGTRKGVFIYHRTSRRRGRTAAEKQSRFVDPASYIDEKQTDRFATFFTQRQTKSLAFVDVIASAKHNETMPRNKKRIAGQKNRKDDGDRRIIDTQISRFHTP